MDIKVNKDKNNTYIATVTLDVAETKKYLDEALEHEAENMNIEGFRKGRAPINLVKEKVDKSSLRGHALNHIFSEAYSKLIKENRLNPIINPRFEIKKFEDDSELEFDIHIVEKPEIKLGDYKKELQTKYKEKQKSQKYVKKTEKNDEKPEENSEEKSGSLTNQEIINTLIEVCDVEVAELIINEEVERMLSSLIDQTAKMGLTIDQYLQAVNKTTEEIRNDYKKNAEMNLKGDFILTEIALTESVEVTDNDIQLTINSVPDEKSREELAKPEQKSYIKAILVKSKTLELLKNEAEKEKNNE